MDLKDKKVIVTGGAKGIGKCIAEKMIEKGATVGIFDVNKERLNALKKNDYIYYKVCDVSNYNEVEAAVNEFYEKYKSIDILINNAGIIYNSPLISLTGGGIKKHAVDMWQKVINIDLSSVFYMTVNVAEKMIANRTKGVIVNVSSICAAGNAGQSAYSAAKAGVNALTATWAKELGLMGIRVIAVAPGFAETETMKQAMNENVIKDWIRKVPLRRLGKPEEIADGVIAIINNDFFNGKVYELDGGLVIGS